MNKKQFIEVYILSSNVNWEKLVERKVHEKKGKCLSISIIFSFTLENMFFFKFVVNFRVKSILHPLNYRQSHPEL